MNEKVDILLATYEGSLYLNEQIESILNQTFQNFHLYVRDDGSTDNSVEILRKYRDKYPDRMTIIPSNKRLGIKGNFSKLMEHSKASYILFCDQDDVWKPNKVEITFRIIKEQETLHGESKPLLVHTDLTVVDKDLEEISTSYWDYTSINPHYDSLNRIIVQNICTGCTMMVNRSLMELSNPIPTEAVMHDWWIALVATAFGRIICIPESTILYRQHGKNDTGAKGLKPDRLLLELCKRFFSREEHPSVKNRNRNKEQASIFIKRYSELLSKPQLELLTIYSESKNLSWFNKRKVLIQKQLFKHGFWRNLNTFLLDP